MADLSDELKPLIAAEMAAYLDGEYMDSSIARYRLSAFARAAIAADRALNAAHSVGAEGMPPLPRGEEAINFTCGCIVYTADQMRAYALAALASRPAVDADKRDAERYRWLRENGDRGCTEKDGYGGQTLMMVSDLDAAIDAARHPAQREGE